MFLEALLCVQHSGDPELKKTCLSYQGGPSLVGRQACEQANFPDAGKD